MEKGASRRGRRGKQGNVRNSGSEESTVSNADLVNGKEKITDIDEDNAEDQPVASEEVKDKEDSVNDEAKAGNTESSEFLGFDEKPDPSGATVLNELVGKYEADLDENSPKKDGSEAPGDAQDGHKVLGQDIYTDSEDESPKQPKGTKQIKAASKKRPLEKLAEEFNEDEKPASPPMKRARKKSAKAREAAGDNMVNMKLLSDVSSEVTSTGEVSTDTKAIKEETQADLNSSEAKAKKSLDGDSVRRGRHGTKDVTDPMYLIPLDMGWRRELVYRQTNPKAGPEGKRTGDIYYYTPEGKKVRSRVEILEHLRGTGLTVDHFCFLKEPLGVKDSSKEIIREASTRKASLDAPPVKREKSPKITKVRVSKGPSAADSPAASDDTSNTSAVGSNGPNTSPSSKVATPKSALKSANKSPKPVLKVKIGPSKKVNTESPPVKKGPGRPRKDRGENLKTNDAPPSEAAPSNWDSNSQESTEQGSGPWKPKSKRVKLADTPDASVESTTGTTQSKTHGRGNMENFIGDLSNGYGALFHVMGYLKVQELLRASRVSRMWRDLSLHPNLWHTVRMKNSQVTDWDGFAAAISARGTRVLDLRKMLAPGSPEDIENMWSEFCRVIRKADSLQRVELSRCPASVVEQLANSCPQLRVINAIAIKSEEVNLEPIRNLPLLEELRLKSNNGMNIMNKTLDPLLHCRLKHLSLTSVRNLGSCNLEVISELTNLESLELGECVKLSDDFGPACLSKLTKLERLRLERGQVPGCPLISILESISQLPALKQLEIINFDVKPGFDKALGMCKQLRRLLIIPTYITTSALTNHIVLCSLPLLADSLEYLVWGLTQELTRVTDLFIDQCEARKGAQGSNKLNAFPGECIPVVKPVLTDEKEKVKEKKPENGEAIDKETSEEMDVDEKKEGQDGEDKQKEGDDSANSDCDDVESLARDFRILSSLSEPQDTIPVPPVRILPIPKLHKLLNLLLPNTRIKILKVPYTSTWRQTFPDLSTI